MVTPETVPQKKPLLPNAGRDEVVKYLSGHLPTGLSRDRLGELSCLGLSRLIMDDLGGPDKARVYWMEQNNPFLAHALVVRANGEPTDKPYNNWNGVVSSAYAPSYGEQPDQKVDTRFVMKYGIDITDEVLGEEWENL